MNTLKLTLSDGSEEFVECFARSGNLAVTRGFALPFDSPGEWRVTHVPSSIALPYLFRTKTAARRAMREAARAVDWPKFTRKLAAGEKPHRAIRSLRRICEANGGVHYQSLDEPPLDDTLARLRETEAA